jgi:transcriptional regulator with XRE-family HTH domain
MTTTLMPSAALRTVLEQLEQGFKLERHDLASTIGVTPRTLERWHSEEAYPQRDARRRLADLIELDRHLQETFTTRDAVHGWLLDDNRYLGGIKPVEALKIGRYDRVEAALEALDSGIFL